MSVGYNTTTSEGSLNVPLTPLQLNSQFDDVFPPDTPQGREQDACLPNQVQDLSIHQQSHPNSHQTRTAKPSPSGGCPGNGTDGRFMHGSDYDRSASRDLQQFAARQYRRGLQVPNTLDIGHTSRDGPYPCATFYSPQYSNVAASPMSDCGGMPSNNFSADRSNDMNSRNRSWSADYYGHHGRVSLPSPGNNQHLTNAQQRLSQKGAGQYEMDNSTLTTSEPPPLSHLPVPLPGYRTPHDGNRPRNNFTPADRFQFHQNNHHTSTYKMANDVPNSNEFSNSVGYSPTGRTGNGAEFRMPHPWPGKNLH